MKSLLRCLSQAAFCAFLAGAGLLYSRPLRAQERPPVADLTAKRVKFTATRMTMAEMAALWSQQAGCSVVIDDEPRKKEANIDADGTAQEFLERIASAFDYDWTRRTSGMILMRKAFHDRREAPQTNLPEMRQMAKQAIAALSAFPCSPDRRRDIAQAKELYKTFSPDQLAQLQAGKRLHAADLQPQQADLMQQIIVNKLFAGAVGDWQNLLDMLDAAPASHVQMEASNLGCLFCYRWLTPANGEQPVLLAILPLGASK